MTVIGLPTDKNVHKTHMNVIKPPPIITLQSENQPIIDKNEENQQPITTLQQESEPIIEKNEENSNESTKDDTEMIEIPEDMYNAVKPLTEFYFQQVQKLIQKENKQTVGKPTDNNEVTLKTKPQRKISKSLLKAAVNPLAQYYTKNFKKLLPLEYDKMTPSKPKQGVQNFDWSTLPGSTEYGRCLNCVGFGYSCMLCFCMTSQVCCDLYGE